jgi:hypothetical protein
MKKLFNFFRNIRGELRPKNKYAVRVKIWEDQTQQYVASADFTCMAHSKMEAEERIKDSVRLHVTNSWIIRPTNGQAK